MTSPNNILLTFYGDDFTGSTDALEFISKAGAKAMLFIEPPTVEQLKQYPELEVIGIAGKTRALPTAEMELALNDAFGKIKNYNSRHVHYKVCSTFDSAPHIGSIGKAIDCGASIFENKLTPVLGGAPSLGRYCVFGNLFARMGIGSNGAIYRLDRHPSMSKHPVTPSDESDLRLHLSKQTDKKFALIDVVQLERPVTEWHHSINDEEVVLIDTLQEAQLEKIGEWLNNEVKGQTIFSVGGSGIETALGADWNKTGRLKKKTDWPTIDAVQPLLVVSGSCSPVTKKQIEFAKSVGFEEIVIDALKVCNEGLSAKVVEEVSKILAEKKSVIVHTGDKNGANLSSEKLGTALGMVAKEAVVKNNLKRVVVAGGDTSSYAARALEIDAVEMIAPLVAGAPLCKAHSANQKINALEVNFKGGQVGSENYFEILRRGKL